MYLVDQSVLPTDKDFRLIYESMTIFKYIGKLHALTDRLLGEKTIKNAEASLVKTFYSRLYPYFLWCLYYGSMAESAYAEQTIIRLYVNEIEEETISTIRAIQRKALHKLIESEWKDLKDHDLKNIAEVGEELFSSQFPEKLQKIAKQFFRFYLNMQMDVLLSPPKIAKEISESKTIRRNFETYVGENIPKYRLERFAGVFEQLNR